MLNRRNAILGWVVWEVGKRVATRKAKAVLPGGSGGASGLRVPAIIGGLAAVAGVLWVWLGRGGDGDEDDEGE